MATLRIDAAYPYPPERVWFALTDERALSEWLMPATSFEPIIGHRFQFRVGRAKGWSTVIDCEVLEAVPPRRLVYTWNTTIPGSRRPLDTRVAWTIVAAGAGTRLRLEHSGFRDTLTSAVFRALTLRPGWRRMLKQLLPRVLPRVHADRSFEPESHHGGGAVPVGQRQRGARMDDRDALQGSWDVTSLEADGRAMPSQAWQGAAIVIKGRRFTSISMGVTYKGTLEIDPSARPKTFDLVFTAGPEKGNRNRGIYKLRGGRWTICLATRGGKRPKTFATTTGSGLALETLQRGDGTRKRRMPGAAVRRAPASKSPAPRVPARVAGTRTDLDGEWAMVSAVLNGAALDRTTVAWCKRVTGDGITTVLAGPQTMLQATFTIDRTVVPHAIDYVNVVGANAGRRQAGIFDLGDGTLRICMAAPGEPRPGVFRSTSGDGRSYTTWRLLKPSLPEPQFPGD